MDCCWGFNHHLAGLSTKNFSKLNPIKHLSATHLPVIYPSFTLLMSRAKHNFSRLSLTLAEMSHDQTKLPSLEDTRILNENRPSGNLLQFAIENGPCVVDLTINNGVNNGIHSWDFTLWLCLT